jgi:hypothetical protein
MTRASKQRRDHVRAWLRRKPPLPELQEAYPDEWATVEREIADLGRRGDAAEVRACLVALSTPRETPGQSRHQAELTAEVRRAMVTAALRDTALRAAAGVEGTIRFNVLNGLVAQRLLFDGGLRRKPVSMRWFRLWWPLVWQRRRLMPLVSGKGIYCFYSQELVTALAAMIGDRRCLEIAAGDGTLSRFLAADGVDITATDDYSWGHRIDFPRDVLRQDARTALRVHRPQVVICSWPPAGNSFERHVFTTSSVELYIVIGSRHEHAAGDWATYRRQADFDLAPDPGLSALVLPPELEPAVHLFRRRGSV